MQFSETKLALQQVLIHFVYREQIYSNNWVNIEEFRSLPCSC